MKTKMIPLMALSLGMFLLAAPLFAADSDGMKMQTGDTMMKEESMSADEMNKKGDQMIAEGKAMRKKAAMMKKETKKEMKKGNKMKGDMKQDEGMGNQMGETKSDGMKK